MTPHLRRFLWLPGALAALSVAIVTFPLEPLSPAALPPRPQHRIGLALRPLVWPPQFTWPVCAPRADWTGGITGEWHYPTTDRLVCFAQ